MPSLVSNLIIYIALLLLPGLSYASMIIGGDTIYTVKKGDTLELVGAHTGVYWWKIAKDNNLDARKHLKPGQELKVNTRKIVPLAIDNGIIINVPDRTLYYFKNNKLVRSFPVGMGLLTSKTSTIWKTPVGKFKILAKVKDPTWHVPPSIQEEMALEGKEVITSVPPGPENPLGRYAVKTTIPGIMIHATIKPASVNQYRSHGCIRVLAENMEGFFEEVEPNTPGELLYMPVKAALTVEKRIYLEVHRDFYSRIKNIKEEAKIQLDKIGATGKVDWQKVEKVLKDRSGIAEDVTL